jgi:SAM-dependent methyltransferase
MQRLTGKLRSVLGLRTPEVYHYEGFDIPIKLMQLTGGGPETFDTISKAHIHNLEKFVGLQPDFSVLEIGCGIGRDAIPLTQRLSSAGSYLGVDIIGPSIQWCNQNIARRFPNFKFVHFDVKDQLHNPAGTLQTSTIHIPLKAGTVDLIVLQSVFTHLLRADIVHYLGEFRRLLRPSGRVYTTLFIINDEILAAARATNLTTWNLTFEHVIEAGCRINDPLHPTGAVAYTAEMLDQMLRETDLRLAQPLLRGAWSGYYPEADDGQDVAILELAPVGAHSSGNLSAQSVPE